MSIVLRAHSIAKKYRIGLRRERYRTLREVLTNALKPSALGVRRFLRTGRTEGGDNDNVIWALKDVSFEVEEGEVLGIIGRNGAGKSTLLKVLARIAEPTDGYVEVRGRVGSLLEVGTGFHPELTGRDNIYLNGAILGMKRREIGAKFDEIVAFAEVDKFIDTPVKHYSSGMYVRLAFAVAAHMEPEILLVDEVLAVGDVAFQKKCLGRMNQVSKEGKTVLFVSHNMAAVLQMCPKAIWIDDGRVVEKGDTRTVIGRYLHDGSIPYGEVIFSKEEKMRGGARLVRAYVRDDQQIEKPDISYDTAFSVVVEYEVEELTKDLRVGFRLFNGRNMPVLHAATSDCPSLNNSMNFPGLHRAEARIPGQWLAPGRYYVELGLWSPGHGHHTHMDDALTFDVVSQEVDGVGEEILRPRLEWKVE